LFLASAGDSSHHEPDRGTTRGAEDRSPLGARAPVRPVVVRSEYSQCGDPDCSVDSFAAEYLLKRVAVR